MLVALALLLLPQTAPELLKDAERLEAQDKPKEALELLDRALELDPKLVAAVIRRYKLHARLNDLEGAQRDVDLLVQLLPENPGAWIARGNLRFDKDPAKALADYSKALSLAPDSVEALEKRGACRLRLKDPRGALADLDRAFELGSSSTTHRAFRGLCLLVVGRPRPAIFDLTLVLEKETKSAPLYLTRAWAYLQVSAWEGALADLATVAELEPSFETWLPRWLAQARSGKRAEADAALEKRIAQNDLTPEQRALALLVLGRPLPEKGPLPAATSDEACQRKFWTAMKELVDGPSPAAFQLLEEASRAAYPMLMEAAAARYMLADLRQQARKGRLDVLERRWRSFKTLHAEFEALRPPDEKKGPQPEDRVLLSFDIDFPGRRLGFLMQEAGKTSFQTRFTSEYLCQIWAPGAEPTAYDWAPFFRLVQDHELQTRRQFDAALGRTSTATPVPMQVRLRLSLDPKPSAEERGNLTFNLGWGTNPASSWGDDIVQAGDAVIEEDGADLVCRLPSRRMTYRLDREKGFLRELEVVDFDGRKRYLRRTAFEADAPFKDVEAPPKIRTSTVPLGELGSTMADVNRILGEQLEAVVEVWPDIAKAQREKPVEALLAGTAARQISARLEISIRAWLRDRLKGVQLQGTTAQALEEKGKELRTELEGFLQKDETAQKALRNLHGQFVEEALRIAIERPALPRSHALLLRLSRGALDYGRVFAALEQDLPAQVERIVREELAALRGL